MHGRWKSDAAKDMYVEESLDNRLQVTKFLSGSCSVCVCIIYRFLVSYVNLLLTVK